jgi:hypothetical protein
VSLHEVKTRPGISDLKREAHFSNWQSVFHLECVKPQYHFRSQDPKSERQQLLHEEFLPYWSNGIPWDPSTWRHSSSAYWSIQC